MYHLISRRLVLNVLTITVTAVVKARFNHIQFYI